MGKTVELIARAKAFSGENVRQHKFRVDLGSGEVTVWDQVAGHYTTCNSLSDSAKKRIAKMAEVAK